MNRCKDTSTILQAADLDLNTAVSLMQSLTDYINSLSCLNVKVGSLLATMYTTSKLHVSVLEVLESLFMKVTKKKLACHQGSIFE